MRIRHNVLVSIVALALLALSACSSAGTLSQPGDQAGAHSRAMQDDSGQVPKMPGH